MEKANCRLGDGAATIRKFLAGFALKGSHPAEEKVLLSRNNDFLSIGKHEENVSRVQETRLFHVGEVDDTIARRAEKRGAIQPALTVQEQTPDESGAVGQVDACMAGASFKIPNVCRSDQPALAALAQKDEVIQTKGAIGLFRSQAGRSVGLKGIEYSTWRHRRLFLRHVVMMLRDLLSRG